MAEMMAICGIDCARCSAYLATQADDNALRAKTATEWSKMFEHEFKPEDINCDGCLQEDGRHVGYCGMCEIRKCGRERELTSCAYCRDYACEKLEGFFKMGPADARANLEKLRKQSRL